MEDSLKAQKYESKRNRRRENKGRGIWVNILLFIICIGLWGTIVYYGYINAKAYVDTSISSVEQSNIIAVEQLKEEVKIVNSEIKILRNEIKDLKEEVRDADSTLSDSNYIQENIGEKLRYLDEKLIELQKSLKILEGAPNAKN